MSKRIATIALTVAVIFSAIALVPRIIAMRLPGDNRDFEPQQPIAFSHRLHAGELNVPCLYCHSGAEKSRHAGLPSASQCLNCHRFITAPRSMVRAEEELAKKENRKPRPVTSPEIGKLYYAYNRNLPIVWTRVHHLPSFAYFDHRPHVAAGLDCQKCHGAVETMERVRQVEPLNMGQCVNCHRGRDGTLLAGQPVKASSDCSSCHF